jgi:uncharacterized membrane protein YidH (DUF202 family)
MEHETLQGSFALALIAVGVATVLAVVMLVRIRRGRRGGQPVASATWLAFLVAMSIAGVSTGYFVYERSQKCDRTVSRTLCESPREWLRHLR